MHNIKITNQTTEKIKSLSYTLFVLIVAIIPLGQLNASFIGEYSLTVVLFAVLVAINLPNIKAYLQSTILKENIWQILLLYFIFSLPGFLRTSQGLSIVHYFVAYFPYTMLLFFSIDNGKKIDNILQFFVLSLFIVSGIALLTIFLKDDYFSKIFTMPFANVIYDLWRINGTEVNANAFALYCIVGELISMHYYLIAKNNLFRIIWGGLIFMFLSVLILTWCRSAIVTTLITSSVYAWYWACKTKHTVKHKIILLSILCIICVCGVGVGRYLLPVHNQKINVMNYTTSKYYTNGIIDSDSSTINENNNKITYSTRALSDKAIAIHLRSSVYINCFKILYTNPFGVGYGKFPIAFHQLTNNQYINYSISNAHNMFLSIGCELGLLALLIFVCFLILIFKSAYTSISKIENVDIKMQKYLLIILLFAYCSNGMFHDCYINNLLWTIIGLNLVAAKKLHAS